MPEANATKPPGSPVLQFSVMLPNRTGALESLIRLVQQAGAEILGMSMQDSRDATVVRIATTDPESTRQIFLEKGMPHTTCELLVVALRDPGKGLQDCLRELRLAETNIDFAYALIPHPRLRVRPGGAAQRRVGDRHAGRFEPVGGAGQSPSRCREGRPASRSLPSTKSLSRGSR